MSTSASAPSNLPFWRAKIGPISISAGVTWAVLVATYYFLAREGLDRNDLIGLAIVVLASLATTVYLCIDIALQWSWYQAREAADRLERQVKRALEIKSYVDSAEAAITRAYNELPQATEARTLALYMAVREGLLTIEDLLTRDYPECGRLSDQVLRIAGFRTRESLKAQMARVETQITRWQPVVG